MLKKFHLFHIVSLRPWPILRSLAICRTVLSFILFLKERELSGFLVRLISLLIYVWLWWRDVNREALFLGDHNIKVQDGLKLGVGFFIFREVMFFFSWFWIIFHGRVSPIWNIGDIWPPYSIIVLNPFSIPLLNTAILLRSGICVTWSHDQLLKNERLSKSMCLVVLLGALFTFLQLGEYMTRRFSVRDRVYGSGFFVSTGFHGIHVIIGTLFLSTELFRFLFNNINSLHHLGFEAAVWYWHFVDVVWLFLFTFIYWWGV